MSSVSQEQIVAEFRASRGRVSGPLSDGRVLLLTTVDATSGENVTVPVRFQHASDETA
ncbi:hypothetical protein [Nocardiopsis rhodophaea]|uniref:hypothetical protein n=1 Tax=Nocardiopsis rhodophaea TaxID=280238 RepID=UPI0031D67BF7